MFLKILKALEEYERLEELEECPTEDLSVEKYIEANINK